MADLIVAMEAYFKDQGRRLAAIRVACANVNQTSWADLVGTSKGYWSELENNHKELSLAMARVIKAKWHLPLDFILDGDITLLDQAPARYVRRLEEIANSAA